MKEDKASNFELNVIKIGVNRFQLEKGDRFTSNGSSFQYQPIGGVNKGKLRYKNWHQATSISAKKYQKDVLRADNIKLIVDRPMGTEADHKFRWKEWVVDYAYVIPEDDHEKIICLWIWNEMGGGVFHFQTKELRVERETKEMFFLKDDVPISYHKKVEKSQLKIISKYQAHYFGSVRLYGLCYVEDVHEVQDKLFDAFEKSLEDHLKSLINQVQKAKQDLIAFGKLRTQHGYTPKVRRTN